MKALSGADLVRARYRCRHCGSEGWRGTLTGAQLAQHARPDGRDCLRARAEYVTRHREREQRARAGCVELRRRKVGVVVGVYRAEAACLDNAGGPWVTVCEDHGRLCNHETLKMARAHAVVPEEWCGVCSGDEEPDADTPEAKA